MSKLVCGMGINDADYVVRPKISGRRVQNRIYSTWVDMLTRCYSEKSKKVRPTYEGCWVCEEWLVFGNFKRWMDSQDYENKQLDKDILIIGNKNYSPEKCVFVSRQVNTLLNNRRAARGSCRQGVVLRSSGVFYAQINTYGRTKHLGIRKTEAEAYALYVPAKAAYIREVADTQEPRVKAGLYRHAKALEDSLSLVINQTQEVTA